MAGLSLPTPSWAPGQLHSLLRAVQGPQQEGQSQDEHFSFFSLKVYTLLPTFPYFSTSWPCQPLLYSATRRVTFFLF